MNMNSEPNVEFSAGTPPCVSDRHAFLTRV